MLLLYIPQLKDLALERGFKVTNETIKISEPNHPYSSPNKSLEINLRNKEKPWIGFSYNSSTPEKLSNAKNERSKCESYLKYLESFEQTPNELMHLSGDASYIQKGDPGSKDSYLFFCIKCPNSNEAALDALENLSIVAKGDKRGRFLRLKKRRSENIINELKLLGNLSSVTNYDFNQTEVEDLYSLLVENLKSIFTLFDQGTPQERLERILNRDREELLQLERSDPDLYNYMKETGAGSLIASFDDKKENKLSQEDFLSHSSSLESKIDRIQEELNFFRQNSMQIEHNFLRLNDRLEAIIHGFNLERD